MKNIKFLFFAALIFTVFAAPALCLEKNKATSQAVGAVSSVVIPESEYRFDSVPEGTKITHAYTIQNRGTIPIEVLRVKTG